MPQGISRSRGVFVTPVARGERHAGHCFDGSRRAPLPERDLDEGFPFGQVVPVEREELEPDLLPSVDVRSRAHDDRVNLESAGGELHSKLDELPLRRSRLHAQAEPPVACVDQLRGLDPAPPNNEDWNGGTEPDVARALCTRHEMENGGVARTFRPQSPPSASIVGRGELSAASFQGSRRNRAGRLFGGHDRVEFASDAGELNLGQPNPAA